MRLWGTRLSAALTVVALLAGCATVNQVHQRDLDAWVGAPVGALDTHSFFITLPMIKTLTPEGIEIRNYPNKRNIDQCFGGGGVNVGGYSTYANYNSYTRCAGGLVGCDNIFYIKDAIVREYVPTGNCRTDSFLQPEQRYKKLIEE